MNLYINSKRNYPFQNIIFDSKYNIKIIKKYRVFNSTSTLPTPLFTWFFSFSFFNIFYDCVFYCFDLWMRRGRRVDCTHHAGWHFINEINQFFVIRYFLLFCFFVMVNLWSVRRRESGGVFYDAFGQGLIIYVGVVVVVALALAGCLVGRVFSWRPFTICQRGPNV